MDSYVDPVLRMHERCTAPRKSLIGNWVHSYPDDAYPGPNLDWYHELVRFFDHWLKGIDNGVMDEPGFVVFRHEYAPPEPFPRTWPGSGWRAGDLAAADRRERAPPRAGAAALRRGAARRPPASPSSGRRHRATTGTRALALVGRRVRPERPRPRPAAGRVAGPDLHLRAAGRAARRRRVRGRGAGLGVERPVATAVVG